MEHKSNTLRNKKSALNLGDYSAAIRQDSLQSCAPNATIPIYRESTRAAFVRFKGLEITQG